MPCPCLKKSGLEIKDIKQFMEWCSEGGSTYEQRRDLFAQQEAALEAEIEEKGQALSLIRFKRWYYEQALADGNEDRLAAMGPDGFPEGVQELYDRGHGRDYGC